MPRTHISYPPTVNHLAMSERMIGFPLKAGYFHTQLLPLHCFSLHKDEFFHFIDADVLKSKVMESPILPTQPIETNTEPISSCEKNDAKVSQLSTMHEPSEKMVAELEQIKESLQRDIESLDPFNATISFISNIDEFYILRESNNSKFESVLIDCQEPGPALASVDVGAMCLATKDDVWMRARIEKISGDKTKAKIFFVDVGCRATQQISDLRVLSCHRETEDLVERVGLFGVEPLDGENWSVESTNTFEKLVDVDTENMFRISKKVGCDRVKVETLNGLDLAEVLVEREAAKPLSGHFTHI